jgi:hypothetical protein
MLGEGWEPRLMAIGGAAASRNRREALSDAHFSPTAAELAALTMSR